MTNFLANSWVAFSEDAQTSFICPCAYHAYQIAAYNNYHSDNHYYCEALSKALVDGEFARPSTHLRFSREKPVFKLAADERAFLRKADRSLKKALPHLTPPMRGAILLKFLGRKGREYSDSTAFYSREKSFIGCPKMRIMAITIDYIAFNYKQSLSGITREYVYMREKACDKYSQSDIRNLLLIAAGKKHADGKPARLHNLPLI